MHEVGQKSALMSAPSPPCCMAYSTRPCRIVRARSSPTPPLSRPAPRRPHGRGRGGVDERLQPEPDHDRRRQRQPRHRPVEMRDTRDHAECDRGSSITDGVSSMRLAAPWSNAIRLACGRSSRSCGRSYSLSLVFEVLFGDPEFSPASAFPTAVIPTVVFMYMAVRSLRRGVVISDDRLTARRLFLSRHHRWETIARFEVESVEGNDEWHPRSFVRMVERSGSDEKPTTVRLPLGGGFIWREEKGPRRLGYADSLNA